jgi:hypothetical protein
MNRYVYAFHVERKDDEVFFRFPKLPEIISAMSINEFEAMNPHAIEKYALDAVLTALQMHIYNRSAIPRSDNPSLAKADGFVILSVQQAMKLELFKLYRENSRSISELSRQLEKRETSVRRLLDLRHQSWATEIEGAIEAFGKRLVHNWDIEAATPASRARASSSPPNP